jgi:large subunit ribosomal protein L10
MVMKEKEIIVADLEQRLKDMSLVLLTEYRGLTVSEISELRSKLKPLGCDFKVIKNSLSKIALKNAGLEEMSKYMEGPIAMAFEKNDPVAPVQILVNFAKEHKNLKLKAGLLSKKIITDKDINILANLPSKEVLVVQVLSAIQGPLVGLVNSLNGVIQNFVYVIEAVRKQKEAK